MASNETNPELESFREQWRAEVQSKVPGSRNQPQQIRQAAAGPPDPQPNARPRVPKVSEPPRKQQPGTEKKVAQPEEEEEEYVSQSFDEPETAVSSTLRSQAEPSEADNGEPVSALDHYEQAVEREVAGNLGDSLRLYRKAYRVSPRHPSVLLTNSHRHSSTTASTCSTGRSTSRQPSHPNQQTPRQTHPTPPPQSQTQPTTRPTPPSSVRSPSKS